MSGGMVNYVFQASRGTLKLTKGKRIWHGEESEEIPGIRIDHQDHLYSTDDPEIIAALDKHPGYGVTFMRLENSEDFDTILRNSRETVRFSRGPATTMAERLGAPKSVPPDSTPISERLGKGKAGKDKED